MLPALSCLLSGLREVLTDKGSVLEYHTDLLELTYQQIFIVHSHIPSSSGITPDDVLDQPGVEGLAFEIDVVLFGKGLVHVDVLQSPEIVTFSQVDNADLVCGRRRTRSMISKHWNVVSTLDVCTCVSSRSTRTFLLKALDDFPDQPPLNAIGLNHNEALFQGHRDGSLRYSLLSIFSTYLCIVV